MRMTFRAAGCGVLAAAMALWAAPARAQNPDEMMPDQSAAKAQEILKQVIAALGGQAYLDVRSSDCTGRLAQFGHSGDLNGYAKFHDYWLFPDKNRTEYDKKGTIVELFNGNQGWTLDKGGVTDEPADAVHDFQEQVKTDMDNVLRFRLQEDGIAFRYGGADLVDLKQADWIEIADREHRTFRMAVDQSTHLPVRWVIVSRNPLTRERSEDNTIYSEFLPIDGVQTPRKIARWHDGRETFEAYYDTCKYNTGLSADLFSKASLDQRYAQVGKKKDKDNKKKN